jgi:hypothetical protein
MNIPVLRGSIERRILVNYRVDPEVASRILPKPFRPKLVGGYALAGICLIRLAHVRPRGLPAWIGIRSENAAHRVAVVWNDGDREREGVYIPRRDTSSWINRLAGGRIFPGDHNAASFKVEESDSSYSVEMRSHDGVASVRVAGRRAEEMPSGSVFGSIEDASRFFESGSVGYSETSLPRQYDGLELRAFRWRVEPLDVTGVASSFFEDAARFPAKSAEFDCALVMRDIEHEWHAREAIVCAA